MKIVFISDTHTKHRQLTMPEADIMVHCGDITFDGIKADNYNLQDFNYWLKELPYKHKIIIAGNHELGFSKIDIESKRRIFSNGTYLEDSGIEIDGINFYGSPHQPWFFDWEFNFSKIPQVYEQQAKLTWNKIPDNTNVLITHSPPYSILDKLENPRKNEDPHVGCKYLFERVKQINKLKIHAYGHIHSNSGIKEINNVKFVNAAILNEQYQVEYKPKVIEI